MQLSESSTTCVLTALHVSFFWWKIWHDFHTLLLFEFDYYLAFIAVLGEGNIFFPGGVETFENMRKSFTSTAVPCIRNCTYIDSKQLLLIWKSLLQNILEYLLEKRVVIADYRFFKMVVIPKHGYNTSLVKQNKTEGYTTKKTNCVSKWKYGPKFLQMHVL